MPWLASHRLLEPPCRMEHRDIAHVPIHSALVLRTLAVSDGVAAMGSSTEPAILTNLIP